MNANRFAKRAGLALVLIMPLAGGIAVLGPRVAASPEPAAPAEAPAATAAAAAIDAAAVERELGSAARVVVSRVEAAEVDATQPLSSWDEPGAEAESPTGQRIIVSLDARKLWFIEGRDTVMTTEVAVGKGTGFSYNGKSWTFNTPRGTRRVLSKREKPIWVPPTWHYYEKAAKRGLEVVELKPGDRHELGDGSVIEARDSVIGRVNARGQWWEWTPGMEIIFDGKIFVPPLNSPQRRVPEALGPYKLDLGEGYLIHGTHIYNEDSIGQAVSHGCIRMRNEDLTALYPRVKVGTPVQIK